MTDQPQSVEPEVGTFSLWFLRGALVMTTIVVLGFLVHATIGLFDGGSDDPGPAEAAPTSSVAPVDEPTTTVDLPDDSTTTLDPSAESTDEEAELQAFVDEAIAFIETTRHGEFLTRPVVEIVSADTLTKTVLDDLRAQLADDPDAAAATLAFGRSIGFFGPNDEILDVYEVFVSGGVLGVYFPGPDKLLVRSAGHLSLSTKTTIVHELVHAFDDQHFDLDREELAEDGDVGWVFAAAVEGSASWVEHQWRAALSAADSAALQAEELGFDPGNIFSLDFGFLIYQTSVYEAGREWLDRRIGVDGVDVIDDALINGAPSSEIVIEALDAPNLEPVAVPVPPVDGDVLWEGHGGQSLVSALTFRVDPSGTVATGWGGDAMVVYRDARGASCVRWDLVGDTPTDTTELFDGLRIWGGSQGATVERIDELVRVDRCA